MSRVLRDQRVDAYLDEVPERRRRAVTELRDACAEELIGFTESFAYRMPSYERAGEVEVAFANRKQYLSLYVMRADVVDAHRARLGRLDVGKSCIRYRRPEDLDLEVVRSMLRATVTSTGPIC